MSLAFTNWNTALQIAVTQENGAAAATELLANILTQLTEVNDGYLNFQLCSLQPTFAPYPTLVEQLDDVCERMVTLARPLSASQVVTGQVVVGSGELWRFEGEEGQIITIEMQAVITGTQTTRLDTYLYLVGQNGTGLGYNDDFGGEPALPFSTDSRIVVTLPEDGMYIMWPPVIALAMVLINSVLR